MQKLEVHVKVLFHRKLKYDTQSDENFDDRDELLSILRLYYVKGITPFFDLFFNLEGSLNKTVYLFAERSSNNNTRRVIKFSGGGDYKIGILRSKNEAIVSANYTVYDFEELNPNLSSFSFRQLYLKDSTQVKLSKNVVKIFLWNSNSGITNLYFHYFIFEKI